MTSNVSQRVSFPAELSVSGAFSGSDQALGVTTNESVWACFDNQSTVEVALYINGVLWHTFPSGEAIVIDMNTNRGNAPVLPIPANTRFSLIGTGGTGNFSVSLIYKE